MLSSGEKIHIDIGSITLCYGFESAHFPQASEKFTQPKHIGSTGSTCEALRDARILATEI